MNEIEFFEANKDKVQATAEFLCSKDSTCTVEEKFEELRLQYINKDGNHHNETISINGQQLPINSWLEQLTHEFVENFIIIAIGGQKTEIIYKLIGNQFSGYNINLDDVDKAILNYKVKYMCNNIGFYVVHNHPFIYKASPSEADLQTCEAIFKDFERIEMNAIQLRMKLQLTLIDFAIVTEFDYWSVKQAE